MRSKVATWHLCVLVVIMSKKNSVCARNANIPMELNIKINKMVDLIASLSLEKQELYDKLSRLRTFLKRDNLCEQIGCTQAEFLKNQEVAMSTYYSILVLRIDDLQNNQDG